MWAKNFKCCKRCGGTDRKHLGKGLCAKCYLFSYRKAHRRRLKKQQHDWYVKHVSGTAEQRLRREEEYFGGNRQQTLERDGFRCTKILPNGKRCKNRTNLVVHHIDGRGRSVSKANRNNELSNLMTMCRGCHIDEHRVSRKKYSDATIRKIRIAAKIMSIPAVAKKFGMNHSYCYNIVRGTARSSVQ